MGNNPTTGDIPKHWEFTTLGEICKRGGGKIQTGPFGSQLHASDYVPVGIPTIMPINIGDNRLIEDRIMRITETDANRLEKHRVKPGDIIYSRRGDVERRALVREHEDGWLCGTGCLKIRLGKGIVDPVFASFYFDHPNVREWIVRHAVGATMPNLNTKIMESVPFIVPPLPIQRAIAHILGTLDDKIELNRQMNGTLEAMARAIFKSWFIDFDPTHAKAQGQQPEGMTPDTAKHFPDQFVNSKIGAIPMGWEVGVFTDFVEVISGGTPKTRVEEYWNGNIPWFSIVDAPADADVFVIDTVKMITQAGIDNSSANIMPSLTTIISARGTVGKVALTGVPMAMNQSCYGLRCRRGNFHRFTYLATCNAVEILKQHAHGSVFDTITRATLHSLEVLLPSLPVLDAFERQIKPLLSKIHVYRQESQTLSATRDTLLPKLLSGEIRVGEAEKLLKGIA